MIASGPIVRGDALAARRALAGGALLVILLGAAPGRAESELARLIRDPAPPHAIVVFGTPPGPDGRLEARLRRAFELAAQDPRSLVVVSGGADQGPAQGPFMASRLREWGLPASRVLIEDQALHTHANAMLVTPILARIRPQRVTLVSHAYHLPRAKLHLRWALRLGGLGQVQVEGSGVPGGRRGQPVLKVWLREQRALLRGLGSIAGDARRAWQARRSDGRAGSAGVVARLPRPDPLTSLPRSGRAGK